MATEYLTNDTDLKAVANAIRNKTGGTTEIAYPNGYVSGINKLSNTSDATVTAGDMAKGVVAYGSSGKVTGTVEETKSGNDWTAPGTLGQVAPWVATAHRTVDADVLLRTGAIAQVAIPLSTLGDATVADVAKGKTFTSVAGVVVTGTRESLGGEVTVTLTNDTSSALCYSFPTYNSNDGITSIYTDILIADDYKSITVRAGAVVSCTALAGRRLKALPNSIVQGIRENLVTFVVPSEQDTVTITFAH